MLMASSELHFSASVAIRSQFIASTKTNPEVIRLDLPREQNRVLLVTSEALDAKRIAAAPKKNTRKSVAIASASPAISKQSQYSGDVSPLPIKNERVGYIEEESRLSRSRGGKSATLLEPARQSSTSDAISLSSATLTGQRSVVEDIALEDWPFGRASASSSSTGNSAFIRPPVMDSSRSGQQQKLQALFSASADAESDGGHAVISATAVPRWLMEAEAEADAAATATTLVGGVAERRDRGVGGAKERNEEERDSVKAAWEALVRWSKSLRSKDSTDALARTKKVRGTNGEFLVHEELGGVRTRSRIW